MRAQPDLPNAVTGTVTQLRPPRSETIRFTVRLSPATAARLGELPQRLDRYLDTKAYEPEPVVSHSLTVTHQVHSFLRREAQRTGMTVNGLITKLLDDNELTT